MERYEPDAVALEESFVGADARTALSVGQARGAVLVAAALAGVECAEYAPSRVKQAVCGYGRAEKAQVSAHGADDPRRCPSRPTRRTPPTRSRSRSATRSRRRSCGRSDERSSRVIARLRGTAGRPPGRRARPRGQRCRLPAWPRRRALCGGPRAAPRRSRWRRTCTYARTRCSSTDSPSTAERELFEHLLSVSGVGPKVALAIVSGSTPAELRRAIVLEDTARFEAIPGIGKKTAQRVVLELKEKLASAAVAPEARGGEHSRRGPGRPRRARVSRCWRPSVRWRTSTRTCRPRSACGSL